MLYKDNRIYIDHLRQIFASTEKQIMKQWEKKVPIRLSMHVTYQDIADNNTNYDVGYFFLSEHWNLYFPTEIAFSRILLAIKSSSVSLLLYVMAS